MISFPLTLAFLLTSPDPPALGGELDPEFQIDAAARVEFELGPRQVSIDGDRWAELRALAEGEEPAETPPGPWASSRDVQIEYRPDGVRVRATWELRAVEGGWWTGPLLGPLPGARVESARVDGRELGVTRSSAGEEVAVRLKAGGRARVEMVAFIPREGDATRTPLDLQMMPAVRGRVRVVEGAPAEARLELRSERLTWYAERPGVETGAEQLNLRWVEPPTQIGVEPLQAVGRAAVGLTFGDAEVRGRAQLSWMIRRGQTQRVSFVAAGLGNDLELAGPNLREWARQGDRIVVELQEPAEGRVDLELRWTQGISASGESSMRAPQLSLEGAWRSETFLQIARDGELEVLPRLSAWTAIARAEMPDWATGLIEGNATATFRAEGSSAGEFGLLRFEPVAGPPLVVDVAAYDVATTHEGRSLVHARYDVRNERASHLRVSLPAGMRMLGVRVNGETATPSREADGTWRIPVVRSVESVKGMLSFPVEVIAIGDAETWSKKERRELSLFSVDAPVAVSRVQLYLPPEFDNRLEVGEAHRVDDFSKGEGITYGLGTGATQVQVADELYREAVDGWMRNDFELAQQKLDELGSLGASNSNIEGLQANLDVVSGDKDEERSGEGEALATRRIREQAQMRAVDDKVELEKAAKEAEQLEAAGRYEEAEFRYKEAEDIGKRLAKLEQSESKEQEVYNQSLSSSSARVAEKKKRKVEREDRSRQPKKSRARGWGRSKMSKARSSAPSSAPSSASMPMERERGPEEAVYQLQGANITGEAEGRPGNTAATGVQAGEFYGEGDEDVGGADGDVMVFDFEDDFVDGQLLVPDGAAVGSELSNAEPPPPAPPPPEGATGRDFTAVVDVAPTADRDAAGISLAGTTSAETVTMLPGAAPKRARARRGGARRARGKKSAANESTAAPEAPMADMPAPAMDPNAALAGPVASASAVSVHVPAVGERVLYQRLLLREGETLVLRIDARRKRGVRLP